MPTDMRKRSALPSNVQSEFGAAPHQLGIAQNPVGWLAGRPEAFRTSGGTAADLSGKPHISKEKYHAKLQNIDLPLRHNHACDLFVGRRCARSNTVGLAFAKSEKLVIVNA